MWVKVVGMSEKEEFKVLCPWCSKVVTPERKEDKTICPECGKVIETTLKDKTMRVTRPAVEVEEESEEEIVPASELSIDSSLESLSVEEVAARTPFIIENWQLRPSQFSDRQYAVMECKDATGKFRWNTSAWQVLATLEEAERRGKKRILVREVLYDVQGGRPVRIRIR